MLERLQVTAFKLVVGFVVVATVATNPVQSVSSLSEAFTAAGEFGSAVLSVGGE